MIRTKQQADSHVTDTLKRIKTKQERLIRGYQFAKIYVDIKEYEKAKEYLLGFLSVKDNSASGHKLLGQILEYQGNRSEAAAAYRKSLDFDSQQKDVLLKICELYSQINISPDLAKVWAEKGEQAFPTNDVIFKLKMKAHTANGDGNSPEELLSFFAAELDKCPSDPIRRVKLMRSYMDLQRINEAFTQILEVEAKELYPNSLDWYRCIVDVYKEYKQATGSNTNGKFHQQLLSAMNRLTALSIEQSLTIVEAIGALWSLDQELIRQSRGISSASDEWKALYREIEAQYIFHCGTLILNKAQKERLSWREASTLAYACFLVSHSVPVVNRKTAWYAKASADEKAVYDRWYNDSCWRCSQTGHMLMQKYQSSDGGQQWIDRIQDDYCHQVGRDKLFHILFTQPQQKDGKEQSYLAQSSLFTNNLLIPDKSLLMEWDRVVQQSKPDNLQVAAWTCLHYYSAKDKTQPKYSFVLFERLPYGVQNLETATPETLCQLDALAFLYATVRSAALKHTERCSRYDPYRPDLLPLPINEKLCSDGQSEWWISAYKLHTNNARESLSRMRAVLQRGLETVRLVGTNLGMDVDLIVHLARTFTEEVEEMKSQLDSTQELDVNLSFVQARAVHYWNKATELLEKLEKKRSLPTQRNPMFESHSPSLDEKQISSYLDEGRLCKALEAKEAGRYAEAVRLFSQIKTADAAFQSALLHKELALLEQGVSQNESATQDRERPVSLLTKAKSDLYETLDRLKGDRYHMLNSRVAEEIDDVETRLMRLENVHNSNSFEQEESIENLSGVERLEPAQFRPRSDAITHSTPQVQRIILPEISYTQSETRLRPSPDRLDAQIRSLSHGQDQWLKIIMDEMKDNRGTIQKLQERVMLLESKLQDVQEQLKQYQNALLVAAAQPSGAMAPVPSALQQASALVSQPALVTPSAMMYPPSAYRAEGYDYWTSHGYDPAAALHGYRGFQQPIPSNYGIGYAGMTPRGMPPPPHYPLRSVRPETEDYGPDSFAYGDEYRRETDFTVGPEVVKEHQATGGSGSSGFAPVPALQPGFFSLPRPVPSESSHIGLTGKLEDRVVRISGASIPGQGTVPVTSEIRAIVQSSNSPSVITVGTKPGILRAAVSSAAAGGASERVLPATTSLFGQQHSTSATSVVKPFFNQSSESQKDDEDHDDSYTEPHFEPIVVLPEVVDLKTGEEDETVLFADRVKLYRFTDKQWKERGVGTLKILFNESTIRARILMRREQVHKVCANHYIKPDMTVEKKSPEDVKVLTWKAVDCSDEEPRLEQFCCKFKTEEIADQFIENFKKATKLMTDRKQAPTVDNQKSASEVTSATYFGSAISVPAQQLSAFSVAALAFTSSSGQPAKFSFGVSSSPSTPFSSSTFRPPSSTAAIGMATASSQQLAKPVFAVSQANVKPTESTSVVSGIFRVTSTTSVTASSAQSPLFGSTFSATKVSTFSTQPLPVESTISTTNVATSGTKPTLFGSAISTADATPSNTQPLLFGQTGSALKVSASSTPLFSTTKVTASSTQSPFGSKFSSTPVASAGSQPLAFGSTFSAPSFITGAQQPVFGTTSFTTSNGQPSLFSSTFSAVSVSASTAVTSVTATVSKFSSTSTPSIAVSNAGTTTVTSVLGGFTFNKPPVIKVEEKTDVVDEKKDASKPANPFANFSFTSGTKAVVTKDDDKEKSEKQEVAFGTSKWLASGQDTLNQILSESTSAEVNENNPVSTTPATSAIFGSKTSAFGLSFKTVTESSASAFVSKKVDADIFNAKGQRLFEDGKNSEKDNETGNDEGVEEYVPNRSFEALVSLPEVEVVTGEENETRLFGERAKLYRMDNECKQWKERGIGEIKILKHATSQKFRILMRREQVLKVCANHYITTKMKLLPMKTSETSWCWFARDFSEQEIHEEQLCVKFKTVEEAKNFKSTFEGCQKILAEADTQQKSAAGSKARSANVDQTMKISASEGTSAESSASASLSSLFKPKQGEWQCEVCYVKNSGDKTNCVACESPKPASKVEVMPSKPKIENIGPTSSSSSSLSSLFKPKDGEWQCEACYIKNSGDKAKCIACETPKPGLKIEAVQSPPNNENISAVTSSLSSLFKPKDGEWQCNTCYVKNDSNKMKCAACETPKPGAPAEQPETKPSVQLKLGPNGGFTFGADQPMSFAAGFGSSTPATDSGKKEDGVGFMPKATGFGQVSTGFGGFAFGNTKDAETKTGGGDVVDSSASVVTSGTSQPATDAGKPFSFGQASSGFGATFAAIKSSDSKDQQPASGAGKENAKPIFGTPSTSGSKPVFTFGGAGGTASPASFVFGGKGFSVGLSNAVKSADAPQTTEKPSSSSTPKKPDSSLPAFGPKPVFGNFSFASSSVASPSTTGTDSQSKTISDDSSQKVFGTPSFSFAGVNSDTGKPVESTTLATPTKPAFFATLASPVSPQSPDGLYKNSEGEDDHIIFEPIVRLPENVEVRTGEEDEEVLYSQRAKLYRFVGNEWKERGVGDVKILQHKQKKQVRLLMRREKVLKICMNHRLAPEMSLKQMPNAQGKVLMWHAEDFADGESVHEKFSIRFKDAQVASSFETAFNRALEHLKTTKKTESVVATLPEAASSTFTASSSNSSGKSLLMDLLTKTTSSSRSLQVGGECEVVSVEEPSAQLVEKAQQLQLSRYFYNYLDAAPCPGCVGCDPDSFDFSTIGQRPKRMTSAASRESSAPAQQHLVFGGAGAHPDFSDVAAKAPASIARQKEELKTSSASPAPMKFVFGGSSNVTSFATLDAQQSASVSTTGISAGDQLANTSQPEFLFGDSQSIDFAALAASNASSSSASGFTQSKPDPNFKWEGAGTQLFGGKEAKTNRQNEDGDEDGSGTEDQEEENSGIHFTPIVQLPEVEVKTGEEDEDEAFRERAKLYRFDNGQWKERGVGDMKILRNRVNGTYRLLLRREQVYKVACNHLLSTDMKLLPQRMTENAWCWFAQDFAEGEARMEQFAIRFKTSELANKFKDKFVECQHEIGKATLKGESACASASPAPETKRAGPLAECTQERPSPALVASGTSHPTYREAASNAEDDDEDSTSATSQDEDDEEINLLFSKRATVKYRTNDNVFHEGGMVEIAALEDDDVAGIRLQMHRDNDEAICNHIICTGYEIKRTDQRFTCEWTAKDFSTDEPIRKTFQVTFCSMPALQEFERIFQNGVQMAVQSELSESKADEFYPRPSEDDDSNDEDYDH